MTDINAARFSHLLMWVLLGAILGAMYHYAESPPEVHNPLYPLGLVLTWAAATLVLVSTFREIQAP